VKRAPRASCSGTESGLIGYLTENHLKARSSPNHVSGPASGWDAGLRPQQVQPTAQVQQGVTAMDKDRIAGTAKDVAGKVEGAVGDIAGNAQTQAAGRAREAAGTVQNLYGQAKDAARDAGDAAASYAKEAYNNAYQNSGDTFRDGSQAVAKKVQDNPLGALLIAGGIGFALALMMTRPPRRPPPRWRYQG
jgi:uncharacterized protein YjbJ (UPF0337 family)